ncbi:MAG: M56 family metallopeptidase, partial [Bryobacteraceae bacterium]
QSTLVAIAAAMLAFTLRKNHARTRYWLWLVASVKFLVPFSLLVATGSRLGWPSNPRIARPQFSSVMEQISQPFALPAAVPIRPAGDQASAIPAILFAVWACGFLSIVFCWWIRWRRIRAAVTSASVLALDAEVPVLSSPATLEPGVFGVIRPVLLLPEGITQHLAPAQLKAILDHELCHVRRRDNLAAAIHMLVEAMFWFHPLVWWIGARLVEERERACDEEVLRMGSEPQVYAESILKTCQFYLESPLACMSGVTGSDLKQRIVHIMTHRVAYKLNFGRKLLLAAAGIAAIAGPIAYGLANAPQSQSQPQTSSKNRPSFDVASIKPTKPGTGGPLFLFHPGARFVATGITAKLLLEQAYAVKDSQIAQAPPWFDSERYDIDAKPEEAAGAAIDKLPWNERRETLREMMQSLLAERFKLSLGHETKELPVYTLVVAKNGPKLEKSSFKPPDKPTAPPLPKPGAPLPKGGMWMQGPGHLTSTGAELPMLADVLSLITGRIVIDKTGLPGRYDFR